MVNKEFTDLLIGICLSTDESSVLALAAHLIHLLCSSASKLRKLTLDGLFLFRRERKTGQQLIIKLKNDPSFLDEYYLKLFE